MSRKVELSQLAIMITYYFFSTFLLISTFGGRNVMVQDYIGIRLFLLFYLFLPSQGIQAPVVQPQGSAEKLFTQGNASNLEVIKCQFPSIQIRKSRPVRSAFFTTKNLQRASGDPPRPTRKSKPAQMILSPAFSLPCRYMASADKDSSSYFHIAAFQ